jgi:hypothetical protein
MGQDKLLELLGTQSRRNRLPFLAFRHFDPQSNGIFAGSADITGTPCLQGHLDKFTRLEKPATSSQAISGAIDEKPMCFKGFMRVSKFLIFVTPSRNSVEQFEQRTDRRLIAAASADGVGKDFFEPCKIEQLLVRTSAR